jgi:hypothetical protein
MNAEKQRALKVFFFFFATTMIGSSLSAVVSFIRVEPVFGSLFYLGVALSTKTLLLGLMAPLVVKIMQRWGLWKTTFVSQVFGLIFLLPLGLGFEWGVFPLALAGMLISGIPAVFLGISTTVNLRLLTETEDDYRQSQGRVAIISGTSMLFATLLGAWMARQVSFVGILTFDALTYLAGIFILMANKKSFTHVLDQRHRKLVAAPGVPKTSPAQLGLIRNKAVFWTTITLISLYLLKGLAPVVAGSGSHALVNGVPASVRESLWSIEALAFLCAGWIYRRSKKFRAGSGLPFYFWLNSLCLAPFLMMGMFWSKAIALFVVSLTMILGNMKVRDDLLLSSSSLEFNEKATGYLTLVSNFLMTLSPLLITALLQSSSTEQFIGGVLAIQLILWIFYKTEKLGGLARYPIFRTKG